jgi:hypothetical protein
VTALREALAAQLHSALGRNDWATLVEDERAEVLAAADKLLAAPDLVIRSAVPTDADTERGAKALWMQENHGSEGWAEMAWAEMTSPDDWSEYAFELSETARTVLTAQAGARP